MFATNIRTPFKLQSEEISSLKTTWEKFSVTPLDMAPGHSTHYLNVAKYEQLKKKWRGKKDDCNISFFCLSSSPFLQENDIHKCVNASEKIALKEQ